MPLKTIIDKIWDDHMIADVDGETLLYVDRLLLDEGSRHAFGRLQRDDLKPHRPEQIFGFTDHYVPSTDRAGGIKGVSDPKIREMLEMMTANTAAGQIRLFGFDDANQGILHVVPPELGITQPGLLICGTDSHSSTHGAFGALAFGVGQSDGAHIMATQSVWQQRPQTMRITIDGALPFGVGAKDIILGLIAKFGVGIGVGHAIEYAGEAIRSLSMEQRMTICNMSIEAAGRMGLIAPDEVTYAYMMDRPYMPTGRDLDDALEDWRALPCDDGARLGQDESLDISDLAPMVSWGDNPGQSLPINAKTPSPKDAATEEEAKEIEAALTYMDLRPGTALEDIAIERVFIGSCTNSRIEDLREAAAVAAKGEAKVTAWVVPGSQSVKRQAEAEGLDKIFITAGFEWREPGCSLCTAINGDVLRDGERCVSTSNRNFRGRQGPNGRTHLASPAMAAAAAITGRLTDVRKLG
jgi:3-isopropylmalate/(R)-2-methylmalate dehydratase large subunit